MEIRLEGLQVCNLCDLGFAGHDDFVAHMRSHFLELVPGQLPPPLHFADHGCGRSYGHGFIEGRDEAKLCGTGNRKQGAAAGTRS